MGAKGGEEVLFVVVKLTSRRGRGAHTYFTKCSSPMEPLAIYGVSKFLLFNRSSRSAVVRCASASAIRPKLS
ncbi:hypothetical protein Rcae01_01453 [Novipirellula caenicola]|uniref:Uncharacterized protein n=1 Tax=Novipirellula caenicola TaxID=1536901 RepID=A0ABP9VRC4_9BACT